MSYIAILTGGESSEREVSLKSAFAVQNSLERQGYEVKMYDLSSMDIAQFIYDKNKIDFVRVMIHGVGGEDGQIIGLLDLLGLKYQCTNREVLTITINKYLTKQLWKLAQIPVAHDVLLSSDMTYDQVYDIVTDFNYCCVAKAIGEGSSKGLIIVSSQNQVGEIYDLVQQYGRVLCEEFVSGMEITVAILDRRVLPVIEIIPPEGQIFDFDNKYNGKTKEICPARISDEMAAQVQYLALQAYDAVGCTRYARIDMILGSDGPVLLEINTIPGFTDQSLFPLAAKTDGIDFDTLIQKLMQ